MIIGLAGPADSTGSAGSGLPRNRTRCDIPVLIYQTTFDIVRVHFSKIIIRGGRYADHCDRIEGVDPRPESRRLILFRPASGRVLLHIRFQKPKHRALLRVRAVRIH